MNKVGEVPAMPEGFELTDRLPIHHDNSLPPLHRPTASLAMSIPTQAETSNAPSIEFHNSPLEETLNHRTVLKLDLILLPFVSLLFLLNSLDKSNVGNAETANFTKDAGLQREDLNTAVACFFAFFVLLQPVGAAVGRRYGMAKVVPICMALWGVCTAAHVLIRRKWELITVRVLIGILEGRKFMCNPVDALFLLLKKRFYNLQPVHPVSCWAGVVPWRLDNPSEPDNET